MRKMNDEAGDKLYFSNKICAVTMCNNPATAKDNVKGSGQWYCRYHVDDKNCDAPRIEPDTERADMLRENFIKLGIRQDANGWRKPCMDAIRRMGGFGRFIGNG